MSLLQVAAHAVAGLLLLNGFMFLSQPGMVFYPSERLVTNPRNWGADYEDVTLTTEDGVDLHGWFVPRDGARQVLLFFHGNAGNISHRGASIAVFHELGLDVFIPDYRGYGRSGGSPDEQGLYKDARAAWRWLTEERGYAPEDIIIFGRSLGGAVAAHLAGEVRPRGVILESTFSSATDAARALFPILSRLVVLRFRFDAADAMRRASAPVLVLHSRDDEIIPYALGRRLYEAIATPKRFVDLQGGHNDGFLVSEPAYGQALSAFIASLPEGPAAETAPSP